MEGYCLKCKGKKEMINVVDKTYTITRGEKFGSIGNCKDCNTKISIMRKGVAE